MTRKLVSVLALVLFACGGTETGSDAGSDATGGGDSPSDATGDAGDSGNALDAADAADSACGVCGTGLACCPSSGKCYNPACLSCCMP